MKLLLVAPTIQITNQVYLGFKKLYELKPVLEESGLYPTLLVNNQVDNRV